MKEKEKSLELARLMEWGIHDGRVIINGWHERFDPYGKDGLAQFAVILLKFPEVMMMFAFDKNDNRWLDSEDSEDGDLFHGEPTQETILDEILRMNGVKI